MCAVSLCGTVLLSGGYDETVRVWSLASNEGECVAVLEGHSHFVRGVALAPSAGRVVSLSEKEVIWWAAS